MNALRGLRRIIDRPTSPPTRARYSGEDYELLPSSERSNGSPLPLPNGNSPGSSSLPYSHFRRRSSCFRATAKFSLYYCVHCCTLRRLLIALVVIPVLLVIGVLLSGVPPNYQDIRRIERRFPQHNLTVALESGTKYLRFPGHIWGHGLNNYLQEVFMMAYVAHVTKRSYVFEDYVWSRLPFPYTLYDFALRPTRMPLNAFIAGPTAGGPVSEGPRAVSAEFWEEICPKERRRIISSKDAPTDLDGKAIVDWWASKIRDVKEACVEVDSSEKIVFDSFFFGDSRLLTVWPGLSASPVLKEFDWSPLVQSAVSRNFAVLQPDNARLLYDLQSPQVLPGLVAVHIRRGDYVRHCPRLARWHTQYMALNQFPSYTDKFDPIPLFNNGTKEEIEEYYMEHCFPTQEQVVEKLHKIREEHPGLKRVYVLTNGWGWWFNGLKDKLFKDGWEDLKGSLDIVLDREQTYIAMAVDMAIAEKAEVFIGNGFSSLTSNIMTLRKVKGLPDSTNRFL